MSEMEAFSLLVTSIYDAVLDGALWQMVLAKTAAFVGGTSAGLYYKERSGTSSDVGVVGFVASTGFDPEYIHSYCNRYFKIDPANDSHFLARVAQPVATADSMPPEEFLRTRYFREWARPQRLVDCINVVLERSASRIVLAGVSRHERNGAAGNPTRRRLRLLAPHLRRAVLIGKLVERKDLIASDFAESFDHISAGMFLLDARGRLVHANAAGRRMLEAGDPLKGVDGRLAANDPQSDQAMRQALATAVEGDMAIGIKGIAVPLLTREGERHVAHVLSLATGSRRRAGRTCGAAMALFVQKATIGRPSPPEVIAKAYQLTPTELRVLFAIVEVGGVPDVADALGVSTETVKTHLGRLYDKTGTHRQADLVKLVAGFSSPLLS